MKKVSYSSWRCIALLLALLVCTGCSYYQPTKNVWKTTKGLWNDYVSPPASVDYDDTGDLSPEAVALSKSMMGVDERLLKLERAMQNADKPPTQEWLNGFLAQFPWLSGFAGVKYDGSILGQQPAESLKELDFNPLLYEDAKQNSRALRVDVQPSPLGPEVMVATPLYDGIDFLGVVVAYFDMRNLMEFSSNPDDIVVLCPTALLWPGKYDFASTPLAGVDWTKVVKESAYGTCVNANGSFVYIVRYLGNLPLVFAIPGKGDFAQGNGELEQGYAFFPKERAKVPPPPLPERKPKDESTSAFASSEEELAEAEMAEGQMPEGQSAESAAEGGPRTAQRSSVRGYSSELEPGNRDSMLLGRGQAPRASRVRERELEGENVEVERVQRPGRPAPARGPEELPLDLVPDSEIPTLPGGRPSPFGPKEEQPQRQYTRPSPFGPAGDSSPRAGQADPADTAPVEGTGTGAAQSGGSESAGRLADGEESAVPGTAEEEARDSARQKGAESAPKEPEGPASEAAATEARPRETARPATLPGGRPSPFGPR